MSLTTSQGKASVTQLCEAFGITRQAYYQARKRPKATSRESRRSEGHRWVPDSDLVAGIRRVVAEHAAWGVRKVWAYLRREGLRASRKRVWRWMRELGLTLSSRPRDRSEEGLRGHVCVPESNRRWATDLTTTWTREDGTVALVPVIDCGDRVVFDVEVTKSQESPATLAVVERSLEEVFGRRAGVASGLELRTDHGCQYTGRDCEELCESWDLEHTLAPVARPTGNAVAERFIQTLKVELIWTRDWESIRELREAVQQWLRTYNYERPHEALDWQTPAERRAENLGPSVDTAA